MTILRADANVEKYRSIWLSAQGSLNPDNFIVAIRYTRALFLSLGEWQLLEELNEIIKEQIEEPMGTTVFMAQNIYKNLPFLNSWTRTNSQFIDEMGTKMYKYEIKQRFENIMDWIFRKLSDVEPKIRFSTEKPIL